MKRLIVALAIFGFDVLSAAGQIPIRSATGLVLPREGGGMVLRQDDGKEVEVEWGNSARVVLEVNTRQLDRLRLEGERSPAEVARKSLSALERAALDDAKETFARAGAAIESFLSAPSYKDRMKFVRHPERVAPLMKKFYAENQDGPIKFRTPRDGWKMQPYKSFLLTQVERDDFSVSSIAVERGRDGAFLVDWESFVGYCEIPWNQISTKRSTEPFEVRAWASVGDYYNYRFGEGEWACLRLEDIARERTLYGYVNRNSLLMNEIEDVIASKGPTHLTLKLVYPLGVREDSKNQLRIEALVARGWVYPEPSDTPELPTYPGGILKYHVHSSGQVIDYKLPAGPITGVVTIRPGKAAATALREAGEENWIAERGLSLYFGKELRPGEPSDPGMVQFIGRYDPTTQPRTLTIDGKSYEISLKKGGQSTTLLYNILTTEDCKPYVYRATVTGVGTGRDDGSIKAGLIVLSPNGDQTAQDDPDLPRYLFIGDSISGNYGKGLREAMKGKFNLHHPPTNCGPSAKGRESIVEWLGAYGEKGRHWDVISFNFGHWDAGNDKATYQANLEAVIAGLKKTGAKLIWVTTCPVPLGLPPAGELTKDGKAPKRSSGVMEKYLNPWAAEVIAKHPEISTCDQWQFVKDHEDDLFKDWWQGDNVHFGSEAGAVLGKMLAEHVLKVWGE